MATQTLVTSGNKELTVPKQEETELAPFEPMANIDPVERTMMMIERAYASGAPLEHIKQLLDMKREVEADGAKLRAEEAKRAYVAAMAEFKRETIVIARDKTNSQYDSRYASIGSLVNTVTPLLSKHGFSAAWIPDQTAGYKVTCTVTHKMGHSESLAMSMPLDSSGAKNPLQQVKSTMTYLRILTFEMLLGLASQDANLDDDGNGAGGKQKPAMDGVALSEALDNIANAAHLTELKKIYEAAYKTAQAVQDEKGKVVGDKEALKKLIAAKEKRKVELA
jgi:hypothetical protein